MNSKTEKTLHLNLERKWFDMIYQGIKKEEYRELKKYWEDRLQEMCKICDGYCNDKSCKCGGYYDTQKEEWVFVKDFIRFNTITIFKWLRKRQKTICNRASRHGHKNRQSRMGSNSGARIFCIEIGEDFI